MGYQNPLDDMMDEAEDVADLMGQLRAMGITCPELIAASIESETNYKEVVEAQLKAVGEVEAMAKGLDAYIKDLSQRKTRFQKLADALREGIAESLVQSEQKSLVTTFGTITYARSAPSLKVVKEAEIPEQYFEMTLINKDLKADLVAWRKGWDKLDEIKDETERDAAREAYLRAHPPIPGAELIDGKMTLTIRRK